MCVEPKPNKTSELGSPECFHSRTTSRRTERRIAFGKRQKNPDTRLRFLSNLFAKPITYTHMYTHTLSVCVSLSLSLSLSHTHTQTHAGLWFLPAESSFNPKKHRRPSELTATKNCLQSHPHTLIHPRADAHTHARVCQLPSIVCSVVGTVWDKHNKHNVLLSASGGVPLLLFLSISLSLCLAAVNAAWHRSAITAGKFMSCF